jgi:hypothetical protein
LKFGFWLMIVFAEVKVSEHLKSWQLNLEFGSLFFLQKSWTQMKICLPTHCFESDCSQQCWTVECFFLTICWHTCQQHLWFPVSPKLPTQRFVC